MKIEKIIKSPSNIKIIQKINELADHSTNVDVMAWNGYVSTEEDLKKIANPEKGDVYFVTKIGYGFIYTGTEWSTFAPILDIVIPTDDELQKMWGVNTGSGSGGGSLMPGTYDIDITGNAATASKATADSEGNVITDTYETKTNATLSLATKQDKLTFDTMPTTGSTNPVTSDGLKTVLDDKLTVSDTAVSASKLATARTISLTGNASGSAVFDGSGNVSIDTTISQATKAVQDASGNVISDTYATKDYVDKTTKPGVADTIANVDVDTIF